MEASRVSFFKQTKEKMNSELSKREKGKLRLEMFMKNCPDSGIEVQEAIKYAGFDPTIKKELKKGYNFIYNNKKLGNIKEIPVNEFFDGSSKKIKTLYAPNYGKVKVTKKAVEPVKKSDKPVNKDDEKAYKNLVKQIESKFEVVDIHIVSDKNEYNFKLENIEKYKVHHLLEMLWKTLTTFNH